MNIAFEDLKSIKFNEIGELKELFSTNVNDMVAQFSSKYEKSIEKLDEVLNSIKKEEFIKVECKYEDPVKLNIGGAYVMTTLAVLTKVKGSRLERLFNGEIALTQEQDGSFFFDREKKAFKWVLNYLRNDIFYKPQDKYEKELFHNELIYWGLEGILEEMKGKVTADIPKSFYVDHNQFRLLGMNRKYVCAEPQGHMNVNRDHAQGWEFFCSKKVDDNQYINIRTHHNTYLTVQENEEIRHNYHSNDDNKKFKVILLNSDGEDWIGEPQKAKHIAFESCSGKYVSVNDRGQMSCRASKIGKSEIFRYERY